MFSFFKPDPVKKLKNRKKKILEEAMRIQRSGDLRLYALKMEEAEAIQKEIDKKST